MEMFKAENLPPRIPVIMQVAITYIPLSVLPTGRNFGRKIQKWPHQTLSARKSPHTNLLQIFQEMAEKLPNFLEVCFSHKSLDYLQKTEWSTQRSTQIFCY
jgi:hypothetical protein